MALSTSEIESLRAHLAYGNVNVGAYPNSPDGFLDLFTNVIGPNLSAGTETTATTAIAAGSTTTVTPVSMTGIAVNVRLIVDVGDLAEFVTVKSLPSASTFSAVFAHSHPATGYPIATVSGVSRLRMLLHSADKAWNTLQSSRITGTAGIKQLGKGEIEYFEGGAVYSQTLQHYKGIVANISQLVRVRPESSGATSRYELY